MIAIGVDLGGPELDDRGIAKALITAARTAIKVREGDPQSTDECWINPVFIVPGSIWKPDFVGYQRGHFSKKQKGLVVQIAVPVSVADGEAVAGFIGKALRDASEIAFNCFASKSMSFSTLKAEKIIRAIERELTEAR